MFRAVAGLSVPFAPAGDVRPSDAFRAMGGDEEFYIEYFQQPGRAEAEIEQDVRRWLLGFYWSASGDAARRRRRRDDGHRAPRRRSCVDRFAYPDAMPAWLTDDDLDVYAGEFERTGFTGGLNRYRNVDRDWQDLSAFRGRPIEVPALFVGGDRDGPTIWGARSIERFADDAAAAAPLGDPRRLRPLDPAGASRRRQRGAARFPLRRSAEGPARRLGSGP